MRFRMFDRSRDADPVTTRDRGDVTRDGYDDRAAVRDRPMDDGDGYRDDDYRDIDARDPGYDGYPDRSAQRTVVRDGTVVRDDGDYDRTRDDGRDRVVAREDRGAVADGYRADGRPVEGPVDLDDDVADTRRDRELAAVEARRRFGGVDLPASLVGMLTALALLTLLAGIVGAAVGAIGYQTGVHGNQAKLSIGGLVGGIVALLIAYWVGGWAAGRIARYDGVRNGILAGVWTLVLGAILGGLGAWLGSQYNVFANVNLPNWFSGDTRTIGAIVSGVVAVIAMFVGAALGGAAGERYHRRADATLLDTRTGGIGIRRR